MLGSTSLICLLRFAVDIKLSVRHVIKLRVEYKKKEKERRLKHTREREREEKRTE